MSIEMHTIYQCEPLKVAFVAYLIHVTFRIGENKVSLSDYLLNPRCFLDSAAVDTLEPTPAGLL